MMLFQMNDRTTANWRFDAIGSVAESIATKPVSLFFEHIFRIFCELARVSSTPAVTVIARIWLNRAMLE